MLDQSGNGKLLIVPTEPESSRIPIVGVVWYHEDPEHSPDYCYDGVDDEEPIIVLAKGID